MCECMGVSRERIRESRWGSMVSPGGDMLAIAPVGRTLVWLELEYSCS